MKRLVCVLSAFSIVMIFIFTGCSKAASPTPLAAKDIVGKSYDSMQTVNSFHFVLDHLGGGTPITMGIEMTKAEGDVVRPDKMQATIAGNAMGMSIEVKLVTSGGKTMMTNPLSGNWESPGDQFQILSVFDPSSGIAAIIKGITNPSSLADEQMGGVLCYHLSGGVPSEAFQSLTGSSVAGAVINTEVWIGQQDFLVRQAKITGKITESEKDGIIRTLTFTNYNQNVNITLPQ
jgi:hypothetical protein